ncbi:MAG: type II CAAX endopeptidase family protein [Clostridia bacterium]
MNKTKTFKNSTLVYFIMLVLFACVRLLGSFGLFGFLGDAQDYVLPLIIQIGILLCLPLFLFSFLEKQPVKTSLKKFYYKKIGIVPILITIGIGLIVFLLNIASSTVFASILRLFGYEGGAGETITSYPIWLLFVNLFLSAVLPGICEETAHRGLLLNGFKSMGVKKAICISALLFGLMHLNVDQFFYATLLGFLLGFLTIFTGSIIPAMIIHFLNNAISIYITFASVNKLFLGNFYTWLNQILTTGPLSNFFVLLLVLFVLFALLAFLCIKLIQKTQVKQLGETADQLAKQHLRQELFSQMGISQTTNAGDNNIILSGPVKVDGKAIFVEFSAKIKDLGLEMDGPPTKFTILEKIFLIGSIILGSLITLSTFIWGIL